MISIIGVLITLLLPAAQHCAGERSEISCKNSLGQLGLAMHNYETAFRTLPPGYVYVRASRERRQLFVGRDAVAPMRDTPLVSVCLPEYFRRLLDPLNFLRLANSDREGQ